MLCLFKSSSPLQTGECRVLTSVNGSVEWRRRHQVGRDGKSAVVLPEKYISRQHALFTVSPRGLVHHISAFETLNKCVLQSARTGRLSELSTTPVNIREGDDLLLV